MTAPSRLTAQASNTFRNSFDHFERTVLSQSQSDHRDFSSTTLQDVRQAAKEVEQQLAARQCLRNMRRIEPFLNGLEAYSKVIEVLCNGTPYLPWIWAPVKLMLKLAKDHIIAFEKLMSAYGRIAENLPRFDRLSQAYRHQPDFQQVLAVVYSDILEFHRQAYKFFKRHSWKCFFKSTWGGFDTRFNCILDSLSRHSDLVDREANAFLITETMRWREDALQAAAHREKERLTTQLTSTLAWLGLDSMPHCGRNQQQNEFDKLIHDCCPGTTDWILNHPKMRTWMRNGQDQSTLWLKGKPGSGKSTLCAIVVQFFKLDKTATTLSCFYNYKISEAHVHPSAFIFATLVSQVLQQKRDLAAYVYEEFVAENLPSSTQTLKHILSNLLPQLSLPRIIIDGIDECLQYDASGKPQSLSLVKDVLNDILQLETFGSQAMSPKLLLASRDIGQMVIKLSRKPMMFLDHEPGILQSAIRRFASYRLSEIRGKFQGVPDIERILNRIEETIVIKSQGMFLWVKLIFMQLEEEAYNVNDLESALANMPDGLHALYARIMGRLQVLTPSSQDRVARILEWMLSSRRPLRTIELQDAIAFSGTTTTLDKGSKLPASVIDLCKPLITILHDDTVDFVHFTVKEFLLDTSFTSMQQAELCIATSCLNYLHFSLDLIDPSISANQRTKFVGQGMYTLQPYVHEHWLDHVLIYASSLGTTATQCPHLEARLRQLVARIESLPSRMQSAVNAPMRDDPESNWTLEPRLALFGAHGNVFHFLREACWQRRCTRLKFENPGESDDADQPHINHNPLAQTHAEYHSKVQLLISSKTFPGLSKEELAAFKRFCGPCAFECRFPGCSHPTAGFPTDEARLQHEKTHASPLLCVAPGCTYRLPFASIQSLKRHDRDHHAVSYVRVPRKVRPNNSRSPLSSQSSDNITHFLCSWCDHKFDDLMKRQIHEIKCHFGKSERARKSCDFCSVDLDDLNSPTFIDHLKATHRGNVGADLRRGHLTCLHVVSRREFTRTVFNDLDLMARTQFKDDEASINFWRAYSATLGLLYRSKIGDLD
ncbi:hypothetical protein CC80DRAFT_479208 [Byssothecium circinans]|uniref:NACHT domain-containing protein n=1 Tax=Byssothecium circinans TaxID=147558 RepID=A0A6A5TL68_9PLEO|nr:hypothetical protein CC80DRAFT_479208 [Byssothecium circinans]